MTSFSEEMRPGMRPASKTLSLTTTLAGAYLGRCLHVSPSEPIVVAKRLRLADGESMIETLHVAETRVPGLTPRTWRKARSTSCCPSAIGSRSSAGSRRSSRPSPTRRSRTRSTCRSPRRPSCSNGPRSQTGEIVEFVRSIYRGDRYRLVTELNRRERGGATPMLQTRDGRAPR